MGCLWASVREDEVKRNAQYLAKYLQKYGYNYVTVDIQWYEPTADSADYHNFAPLLMDQYARLIPDPIRFPSAKNGQGFKSLADYVHSLGLKFGLHMMRGIPRQAVYQDIPIKGTHKTAREIAANNICPWNSDMFGVNVALPEGQAYYNSVMDLYASWGVDFIKCDDIAYSRNLRDTHLAEVHALRKAIDQTGRAMVLSLSPGPAPLKHASFFQQNANMWRITDDFWDQWELLLKMFDRANEWSPISRLGNWSDCDMLPLGHLALRSVDGERYTRFTRAEQRTMLTLWSLLQSPLIIGSELPDLDEGTLALLTQPDILEMDNEGLEKEQIYRDAQMVVWKSRTNKHHYTALFNLSEQELELNDSILAKFKISDQAIDVWSKEPVSGMQLGKHDVCLVKR
ncbi:glycoside hydrolase family 27 protein [Lactobacillus xujianguonis]|uniref:glycoside hydrolase family 27 protein n=1 Tax=Lactobacillus xujianguonis TaxID=2495899 RepID=UPI001FE49698|nr:glycoside hydrolase family 27 protein [Lactobacillus xujianguonis]